MTQTNTLNQANKLFGVTWTVVGSKAYNSKDVEAVTKMEAKATIRWSELKKGHTVKNFIEVKEIKEAA